MDIEGQRTLRSQAFQERIRKDHPMLAVGGNNRHCDPWQIPEQVLAMDDDYDLHLRHDNQCFEETAMYSIPQYDKPYPQG